MSKQTHRQRAPQSSVSIHKTAADIVRRGHPWIWRTALQTLSGKLRTGDEVDVQDAQGHFVARALYDADSPIALRVWSLRPASIENELLAKHLTQALTLRRALFAMPNTTAYRLVHGEGDFMPGIVIDRYEHVAVMRTDGAAARSLAMRGLDTLWEILRGTGVRCLLEKPAKNQGEPRYLRGSNDSATLCFQEYGVTFEVDVEHGQKTGAFLDQRENRRRVGELASGRRVLNLYSYAGGFSLCAALGGAHQVISVDIAQGAHDSAKRSFTRAGLDPNAYRFVAQDVFEYLNHARKTNTTFDLIVSDPPSFAPNERAKQRALASYRKLHRACVELLAHEGIFCAASCSSHVTPEAFLSTLDAQTLGERNLRITGFDGAPADHPRRPTFPEGDYLKFVTLME